MRTVLALAALLLLAGASRASLVEPLLAGACAAAVGPDQAAHLCSLQYDGGQHGDASDDCRGKVPPLPLNGRTTGLAVPVDDERDHYAVALPKALLGVPVTITLVPAPSLRTDGAATGAPLGPNHDLVVWSPQCAAVLGASSRPGSAPEQVTFVPRVAGVYVVEVALGPTALPPAPAHGDGAGYGTDVCHATCYGSLVNPALGYELRAVAG